MQNLVWLGAFVTLSCDSPLFQIEYYMDSHLFTATAIIIRV